jgi:hypothetical protein
VIAAVNDMFRWCPSGTSLRSTLGTCDGGNPDWELNSLRWRIEGVLWLAAAMSGDIPQGMFTSPMPAANFTTATQDAPLNMFYGNGAFQANNPNLAISPVTFSGLFGSVPTNEFAALNIVQPAETADPTSRWFQWGPNAQSQLPAWLGSVYAPTQLAQRLPFPPDIDGAGNAVSFNTGDGSNAPYVHVFGSNYDGTSDFTALNDFFSAIGASGISNQIVPAFWPALSSLLNGHQCPNPTGDDNMGAARIQGLVAALKTGQSATSDMRKFFYASPGNSVLWSTWFSWDSSQGQFTYQSPFTEPTPNANQWLDILPVRLYYPGVFRYDTYYWQPTGCSATGGALCTNPDWNRLPSVVTPNDRVRFALNSAAPNGNCAGAWDLTQAMARLRPADC